MMLQIVIAHERLGIFLGTESGENVWSFDPAACATIAAPAWSSFDAAASYAKRHISVRTVDFHPVVIQHNACAHLHELVRADLGRFIGEMGKTTLKLMTAKGHV